MTKAIQLRGHCQCCAGLWATNGAGMSHHGYTVKKGDGYAWFSGTCNGLTHPPIEIARDVADGTVAWLRERAEAETRAAAEFRAGSRTLETVRGSWDFDARAYRRVAWADAKPWERVEALKEAIFHAEQLARFATRDADRLAELIERVHGKPLVEVKRAEKAAPILRGETRKSPGGLLVASHVDGARVYWSKEREGGKPIRGWTGSAAWRRFELVATV